MASALPKGFKCECGKEHSFVAYVYAHWDEELTHTCDGCQRKHAILRGYVQLMRRKQQRTSTEPAAGE